MLRLPMTLWRACLGDFFRLVALTAFVLVSAISFAAAVKPLSDGNLQAGDGIRFILFAFVPMLAYALPFAAGFASTLVYHRMATENEAIAAHAGGISHRALVMPALIAGMVLAGVLGAMNEQVIPRFLQRMERMITIDVARMLVQGVGRGRAVELNGMLLYADHVQRLTPDPRSGAIDELILSNFAVLALDKDGKPTSEATASRCQLWLVPGEAGENDVAGADQMRVLIQLQKVRGVQPGERVVGQSEDQTLSWVVPNAFRDNPKFLTWGELRELEQDPTQMNWIEARRRHLAAALDARLSLENLGTKLAAEGRAVLGDDEQRTIRIEGRGLEHIGGQDWDKRRWRILPPRAGSPVVVTLGQGTGTLLVIEADDAILNAEVTRGEVQRRSRLHLELSGARVRTGQNESVDRTRVELRSLFPVDPPAPDNTQHNPATLLELARARTDSPGGDSLIAWPAQELDRKLKSLAREVLSKRHERMAIALSCVVMVITGAVTALRFSRSLPLTVYLWTFFPALACIVTISGGQQLVAQVGAPGLFLTWGGVASLGLYTLVLYRGLIKH
ncbi:MAG: LptF/LptG family permease [Phycisphaerales bacterium]|nr:LptF/LptG family permease [Phycisphaerales bacterium]